MASFWQAFRYMGSMAHIDVNQRLCSLDWLSEEASCLTVGSVQRRLIEAQIKSLRSQLPASLQAHRKTLAHKGGARSSQVCKPVRRLSEKADPVAR